MLESPLAGESSLGRRFGESRGRRSSPQLPTGPYHARNTGGGSVSRRHHKLPCPSRCPDWVRVLRAADGPVPASSAQVDPAASRKTRKFLSFVFRIIWPAVTTRWSRAVNKLQPTGRGDGGGTSPSPRSLPEGFRDAQNDLAATTTSPITKTGGRTPCTPDTPCGEDPPWWGWLLWPPSACPLRQLCRQQDHRCPLSRSRPSPNCAR